MTVMRMKESKFGAPAGIYVGKFLGTQPLRDEGKPRLNRDGKPMEPGVEWQWEIVEGDQAGQIVGRITSAVPTTKNACGVLISGLVGRIVRPDEDVDPDHYRGQLYQVVIGPSKENPDKTYVTQVVQKKGGNAHPAAAAAAAPPPRPAPPPSRIAPPPPKKSPPAAPARQPAVYRVFHTSLGEQPVEMLDEAIHALVGPGGSVLPDDLQVYDPMNEKWSTAKEMQLDLPF